MATTVAEMPRLARTAIQYALGRNEVAAGPGPQGIGEALGSALAHDGPALVELVTDSNALSIPPRLGAAPLQGFALAATKTVLGGGVGKMLELARANLRNVPRP